MNFRISVTHLRVALLVANFGLAGGLVGMAGRSMMEASGTVSTVRVFEPSYFEFSEGERYDTRAKRTKIQPVADWLDPTKQVATTPGAGAEGEAEQPAPAEDTGPDYGGPGPLAEEWEYEFYCVFEAAPTESFVRLRRKGTEPAAGAAANAAPRIVRGRTRLQRGVVRTGTTGGENELSFFVKDRRVVDKEKGLEFFVDEATPEYLAYRMPDNHKRVYRLPHADDSPLADYATKKIITIRGLEKASPGAPGEEEEAKEPSKIQIVPADHADLREKEYEDWIAGRLKSLDEAPNLRGLTVEDAIPRKAPEEPEGTASGERTTIQRSTGGRRVPLSQEEGLQNMRSAIREAREKGSMTADDEKLIKDAMSGKLKEPARK